MNKILKFIANKSVQRIFYFTLLLVYNLLIVLNRGIKGDSSIGIPFVWVWIIPTIILIYQTIFNNKIGWYAFFLLYVFYVILTIKSITAWIMWKCDAVIECLLESIPLWLILFAFGWLLYLISPFSKVTNKQKHRKQTE
ncbi:MAG: hypothetical protein BGP01_07685 [Paludibacter sp. 47-17]|nr:MAG: hypothetical protein ABS72_01425 [Paludibacter sp. SCN 50-10]OJX92484.1 MAG: hypothetical protein BGP01_07685 [Paludibacter sp. 47-17]